MRQQLHIVAVCAYLWQMVIICLARIFFMEISDYLYEIRWSSYRHWTPIWFFWDKYVEGVIHRLWHMTGIQLFCVTRDGCHMWGKKISPFPVFMMSLHLGSLWSYPFIIVCILPNLPVFGLCLLIKWFDFVCLDKSRTALSWRFYHNNKYIKDSICIRANVNMYASCTIFQYDCE